MLRRGIIGSVFFRRILFMLTRNGRRPLLKDDRVHCIGPQIAAAIVLIARHPRRLHHTARNQNLSRRIFSRHSNRARPFRLPESLRLSYSVAFSRQVHFDDVFIIIGRNFDAGVGIIVIQRIYSLQDKDFGCVIGRRRITIQPSPSSLAKIFILKPIGNR